MFRFIKNRFALIVASSLLLVSLANAAPMQASDLWIMQKNDSRPLLVLNQKLQIVPKTLHEKTANYLINIRYPQIVGGPLTESARQFNQLVNSLVDKKINAFRNYLAKSASIPVMQGIQSYLKINYDLSGFSSHSQNTEYISTRFSINTFEKGMAHPNQQTEVINYDLGNNKLLSLSDLFNANSAYLEKISNYCINQLRLKNFPEDMLQRGAAPKMENFKNWNVTLSGLLITFDGAQVAPRYYGVPQIVIPNDVLKDVYTHQTSCTLGVIRCDPT